MGLRDLGAEFYNSCSFMAEYLGRTLSPVFHSEALDPLEMLYIVGDEDQVMR